MRLVDVHEFQGAENVLWKLLLERDESVNISHKEKPRWEDHCQFVKHHPYRYWWLILNDFVPVGSLYVTPLNEIGIFILKNYQRGGYASAAIKELLANYPPLPGVQGQRRETYIAHVAPTNDASHSFWESLGGRVIQWTYEIS